MKARKHTTRRFLMGGALLGAGLLGTGCGHSSKGGQPLAGPGSPTNPVPSATAGPIGSGSTGDGLFGGAIATGPAVEITSPARGEWVRGARVTVTGQATDSGKGIASVKVAGMDARLEAGGAWSCEVPVEPGLFTIVVEATDEMGGRTEKHVSVMAGDSAPETALLGQAAAVRVTDEALDMLEPGMGAAIEAQKPAIRQQVLATRVPDVKLTGFDFGKVTTTVDCVDGGMRFQAKIADVVLGMEAEAKFLLIFTKKLKGDVRASMLNIDGTVMVSARDGQPVVQVTQVTARADGFTVPDWANDRRAEIQGGFQQAFAQAAAQNLGQTLSQSFGAAAVSGTTNQSLLGKDLRIEWRFESLSFDAGGANASMGANVRAASPTYGDGQTASFVEQAPLPRLAGGGASGQNVAVAVNQDAINRALHAAWRAGALKMDLDQQAFDQLLPGVPTMLDTTALMQAVPQLAGLLVPGLPIELKVESKLPPVVRVPAQGQAQLELALGELSVKLDVVHPTAGAITLVDAVYAARVPAVLVEQNGRVKLQPQGAGEIHVDLAGQAAMMPGVEGMLENMTRQMSQQAAGPAFQAALAQIQGVPLPAVKGFSLTNVTFSKVERSLVVLGQAGPAARP